MIISQKIKNTIRMARRPLLPISEVVSARRLQKKLAYPEAFDNFIVNPSLITNCIRRNAKRKFFVSGGDWDVNGIAPISEVRPVIFSTVHDMFTYGAHYKETRQYLEMIEGIYSSPVKEVRTSPSFGSYWCKSQEDIDEYFRKLIRAYESIKKDGYKPQSQIAASRPGDSRSLSDEILVLVGRNGEFILGNGGTHRLIIAQSLGLQNVYVRISGVHEDFLGDVLDWKESFRCELINKIKSSGIMHPAKDW